MPDSIYTGSDVSQNTNGVTKRLKSIRIKLNRSDTVINPSDPIAVERVSGVPDCEITVVGYCSGDANAMTAAEALSLVLSGAAPSAISWTDKAATPASMLPADFFDYFPLAKWRYINVDTGSDGPEDAIEWSATVKPNFQNAVYPLPED